MLLDALNTARDLGRLNEIGAVLVRYGLGDVVRRLGVGAALERAGRAVHWGAAEGLAREPQVRMREALEKLGPTFVKLGQILAGRSDLLPPDWTEELARLQQHAAEVPYEELAPQLLEDLGTDPDDVFDDFDRTPLAAASIAQVHRARLKSGEPVVLKVRRPGILETVEADLRLLRRLAELAEERLPELRRFRPRSLVRQFARSLRAELDLRVEAKNAERLRENLADDSGVVVPRVHGTWSGERLCVMEYVEGPAIAEWLRSGRPDGVDPAAVAASGARTVLKMVLVDGCYHADPHAGNVILMPDGRLGLVDFGMVGYLSESRRLEFLDLLAAIVTRRVDEVVDVLLSWSDGEVDVDLLGQDCGAFIDRYYGLSLRQLDVAAALRDLTLVLRENDLFLPADVAMLLKVLITLEGLGRQLDPGFELAVHTEPFVEQAVREQRSPVARMQRGAREVAALAASVPRDLRQLATRLRGGRFHLEIGVEHLDQLGQRIDRSANRVTMGLVTAALIVGTALTLTMAGEPRILGMPAFGFFAFGSSLVAGLWLLWSIARSGRR